MEHKIIKSPRGQVHYWIGRNTNKNAKCIVFTHGLTANHIMFEKQIEYFLEDYTIITWDVPLHGLSRPYSDFSYMNTAVELKSILTTENIDKVVLVGMSMGGYPSQAFALQYPEKVSALIALDTTPFNPQYYSGFDRWCLKQVKPMTKLFSEKTLRKSIAKNNSRTSFGQEMMMKMLESSSKEVIIEQMDIAYGCFIDECRNEKLKCPVLILLGEYDKTGKVKQYCQDWSEKENYPLHIIKNAAHFSNADNYEAVNSEIGEFLNSI